MNKTTIIVLVVVVLLLCCCASTLIGAFAYFNYFSVKSTDTTNTTNTSQTITEVPYEINTFLSQTDLDELESNGFKINKGFLPPKLNGDFVIDNWSVKYDKGGIMDIGDEIATCYYTFSGQSTDGTLDSTFSCSEEKGTGELAYISGKDKCFTMYIDQKGSTSNCDFEMPVVMSGCLTSNGITDFQYANLMKSKTSGSVCDEELMPVNNIRIITVDDGLVEYDLSY
jgi:hypothetical protein